MKKISFILISCCLCFNLSAQNLSAFINIREEFYAFEDSFFHQLDYLPPLSYKVGGNCIAFNDNKNVFQIYQYGAKHTPIEGIVSAYGVSNNYVYVRTPAGAYVWDQGNLHLLTRFPGDYVLCDSVVGFIDESSRNLMVYENEKLSVAEEGITVQPAATFLTSGPNLFAFKTRDYRFGIYWNAEVYEQETEYPQNIKGGTDIVAYLDQYDPGLRVFYRGETTLIESFNPRAFEVGNEVLAYATQEGIFKIFWRGEVYEIGNYIPTFITVKDNIVVYGDRVGYSYAFYQGKSTQLENFIPSPVTISENTIMYYDQSNRLKIFYDGTVYEMPLETYFATRLDYDVVIMEKQGKQFKVFSRGKVYNQ